LEEEDSPAGSFWAAAGRRPSRPSGTAQRERARMGGETVQCIRLRVCLLAAAAAHAVRSVTARPAARPRRGRSRPRRPGPRRARVRSSRPAGGAGAAHPPQPPNRARGRPARLAPAPAPRSPTLHLAQAPMTQEHSRRCSLCRHGTACPPSTPLTHPTGPARALSDACAPPRDPLRPPSLSGVPWRHVTHNPRPARRAARSPRVRATLLARKWAVRTPCRPPPRRCGLSPPTPARAPPFPRCKGPNP
jgi:hypothetical protein